MPRARPMPRIGPIKGEINMAPMITAVELTLSPNEAIKMAKTSTQRLAPRKGTPASMRSMVSCSSLFSGIMLKRRTIRHKPLSWIFILFSYFSVPVDVKWSLMQLLFFLLQK